MWFFYSLYYFFSAMISDPQWLELDEVFEVDRHFTGRFFGKIIFFFCRGEKGETYYNIENSRRNRNFICLHCSRGFVRPWDFSDRWRVLPPLSCATANVHVVNKFNVYRVMISSVTQTTASSNTTSCRHFGNCHGTNNNFIHNNYISLPRRGTRQSKDYTRRGGTPSRGSLHIAVFAGGASSNIESVKYAENA